MNHHKYNDLKTKFTKNDYFDKLEKEVIYQL